MSKVMFLPDNTHGTKDRPAVKRVTQSTAGARSSSTKQELCQRPHVQWWQLQRVAMLSYGTLLWALQLSAHQKRREARARTRTGWTKAYGCEPCHQMLRQPHGSSLAVND